MNGQFTVEESNLISIFEDRSREKVMQDIRTVIPHLEEAGLVELSEQVLEKLGKMSNEDFAQSDFIATE